MTISENIILDKNCDAGLLMKTYLEMNENYKQRLLGYMMALKELSDKK